MQHAELATRLVNSSDANRETLLRGNAALADVELAYKLKDICLEGWSTHPAQALGGRRLAPITLTSSNSS